MTWELNTTVFLTGNEKMKFEINTLCQNCLFEKMDVCSVSSKYKTPCNFAMLVNALKKFALQISWMNMSKIFDNGN